MARGRNESTIVEDMILSCAAGGVTSETAQKAVRALCRRHGGLMVYIPSRKEDGESAERLREIVEDATDGDAAARIVARMMRLYGGTQQYLPLERTAFRKVIAMEIFARVGERGVTMNDMAREYGVSFTQAYRLWREGRAEKLRPTMPYLPFLELSESNNGG